MASDRVGALRRMRYRAGVRQVGPALPGLFSWGVVSGIALVKSGLSVPQALGMTFMVFSGTAQLAALPLIVSGASIMIILITVFLTNLRFLIYSASISRDLRRFRPPLRALLGYLTTDNGLALYQMSDPAHRRRQRASFLFGCNTPVWIAWQLGSLLGIAAATVLPGSSELAYLGLLAVMAIVVQMTRTLIAFWTVISAAAVAVLGSGWPKGSAMMLAILVGIVVALVLERRGDHPERARESRQ